MKLLKTTVALGLLIMLSACGNKSDSLIEVYTKCSVGNQVTITVAEGTFGSSASISCTYIKES